MVMGTNPATWKQPEKAYMRTTCRDTCDLFSAGAKSRLVHEPMASPERWAVPWGWGGQIRGKDHARTDIKRPASVPWERCTQEQRSNGSVTFTFVVTQDEEVRHTLKKAKNRAMAVLTKSFSLSD